MNLYIFDFDGTLFRSPSPNPKLWDERSIGIIKSMRSSQGLGWFQDTITLDTPYVDERPSAQWYITEVVDDVIQYSNTNDPNNSNNICCLLTGRSTLYSDMINRIISHAGLQFKHIGLKPVDGNQTTFDFKKSYINSLIQLYNSNDIVNDDSNTSTTTTNTNLKKKKQINNVNSITIYEDRPEQVDKFNRYIGGELKSKGITGKVIQIIDDDTIYLPHHVELELINQLIKNTMIEMNNSILFQTRAIPSYTALLLDDKTRNNLLKWVQGVPDNWKLKCHHITMNLGDYNPKRWSWNNVDNNNNQNNNNNNNKKKNNHNNYNLSKKKYELDTNHTIEIDAIGFSQESIALRVKNFPSVNYHPHITLAHHPSAKPVSSNSIDNWIPIETIQPNTQINQTQLYLDGTIEDPHIIFGTVSVVNVYSIDKKNQNRNNGNNSKKRNNYDYKSNENNSRMGSGKYSFKNNNRYYSEQNYNNSRNSNFRGQFDDNIDGIN